MVFYLGKDVAVYFTTENEDIGVTPVTTTAGAGSVVDTSTATFACKLQNTGSAVTETEQTDLTSVDLGIGAMDEDITYFGMRTSLKAEIKKETTISLTRKKSNDDWTLVFDKLRYGLTGATVTDVSINSGLAEPTTEYGYRAYVHLSGSSDVMTVPNCVVQGHTVSINADGTTDETLELLSMVSPVVSGANYVAATEDTDL